MRTAPAKPVRAAAKRRLPAGLAPIRPLGPGDEPRLLEFFHSHTPETIHERYGCVVTTMTPERASQLVNVDRTRDCVLGILSSDGSLLHAVGRYCLDPDGEAAELAFVVRETMRRRGLATALLLQLIGLARSRGLRRVWAQANPHNADMLGILRHHGFEVTHDADTGLALATLELDPAHGGTISP